MKLIKTLIIWLALIGVGHAAQPTVGFIERANCATLTTPGLYVYCKQTTTTGGRVAGEMYRWNGTAWEALTGVAGGDDNQSAAEVPFTPSGNIIAADVQTAIQELDTEKQPLDATLSALAAYNTNGILAQTSADTFVGRTLQSVNNEITITNPGGVTGNPTIGLSSTLDFTSKTLIFPNATSLPGGCTNNTVMVDSDATSGQRLYLCESGSWVLQGDGNSGGGGSGHVIQEEGTPLTNRAALNFIGSAITATDNAGSNRTDVTLAISPSSGSVVGSGRTINTSSPLGGGGQLTADLTLTCAGCVTASNTASTQIAVMTGATTLRGYPELTFDGSTFTVGATGGNYIDFIAATLTAPRLVSFPDANSNTIQPKTSATANQWVQWIDGAGVQQLAQPSFSALTGVATNAQIPNLNTLSTGLTINRCVRVGAAGFIEAHTDDCGTGGGGGVFSGTIASTQVAFGTATDTLGGTTEFAYNSTDRKVHIGTNPSVDENNSRKFSVGYDTVLGQGYFDVRGTGTGAGNVGISLITDGTGRVKLNSLQTTGAATGKVLVCVDTADGALYASSSGDTCAN